MPVELRPQSEASLEPLLRWKNDPEIQRMSSDGPVVSSTREQVAATLQRWMTPDPEIVHFAIALRDRAEPIGFLHLAMIEPAHRRCRLGLVVGEKDLWGHGYGRSALRLAVAHAFDVLGLDRITGEVYGDNLRSARLLEGAGFTLEGVMRDSILRDGKPVDELVYGLLRRDLRS